MADLLNTKLLLLYSSSSLSLSSSPPFTFPLLRFSSLLSRKPSRLILACSSQYRLISTSKHTDGSLVFKFAHASEIDQGVEQVDNNEPTHTDTNNGGVDDAIDSGSESKKDDFNAQMKDDTSRDSLFDGCPGGHSERDALNEEDNQESSSVEEENNQKSSLRKVIIDEVHSLTTTMDVKEAYAETVDIRAATTSLESESIYHEGAMSAAESDLLIRHLDTSLPVEDDDVDVELQLDHEDVNVMVESTSDVARSKTELILDDELGGEVRDDTIALEGARSLIKVSNPPNVLHREQNDGDAHGSDISQESGHQVVEDKKPAQTTSLREEVPKTTFFLSSAAASLPNPLQALTGGEDAYFVAGQDWFGVAGGVGHWSFQGIIKGSYAQELMKNCKMLVIGDNRLNIREVLKRSAASTQSPGLASILIASFQDQVLHVANIGDSGLIVIRDGIVIARSSPMVHDFNFPIQIGSGNDPLEFLQDYRIELEAGDLIVTATNGLLDNLYDQEIASMVSKSVQAQMSLKEIAEFLAVKAQELGKSPSRTPFSDAAQAAGLTRYTGGRVDGVVVVVSQVLQQ